MEPVRGGLLPVGLAAHELRAHVVEQLPHPIFVKDRQFRYVLLNAALVRMSGQPLSAMLGKTDYDFLPKAKSDFYREKASQVFSSAAEVVIAEEEIIDGAGRRRVLATRKVPLLGISRRSTKISAPARTSSSTASPSAHRRWRSRRTVSCARNDCPSLDASRAGSPTRYATRSVR